MKAEALRDVPFAFVRKDPAFEDVTRGKCDFLQRVDHHEFFAGEQVLDHEIFVFPEKSKATHHEKGVKP